MKYCWRVRKCLWQRCCWYCTCHTTKTVDLVPYKTQKSRIVLLGRRYEMHDVQGESARRAITGAEFFNRYPTLHPFLLTQLQAAAQQLSQGSSAVHPSLVPILALLSRLR